MLLVSANLDLMMNCSFINLTRLTTQFVSKLFILAKNRCNTLCLKSSENDFIKAAMRLFNISLMNKG